jgi:ATP-dependent protease Clp ATPase subunit
VPFAWGEISSLSKSASADVTAEPLLLKLLNASDFDTERVQRAVVYLDGADQPAAQAPLLEILNDTATRDFHGTPVKMAAILFLCGGTFQVAAHGRADQPITESDLRGWGMMPELASRFLAVVELPPLEEETLCRIASCVDLERLAGAGD